ncbi:MAG: cell division protein FtsW [Methylobacterium sp.]|jgi:cell division protein FtsW|uniref:FtsW/RodA/SpoVE family cell cycle protein n=1 Tax=Bosea sp. (in: a-proteobacteria) TaxID=1871050 RepID=UPI000AB68239|nr:putative peptidoglycan glycosyltransferase FtsW [Bosea sp. (in: a-proteobacteria)]MBA4268840.1 cell division protein FtsW [Methylobacterium sp.]MBA4333741.1 cell division protein FtsW [Methylobacterium sp.]WRH59857.1 MAG: putative peptidoglycan glycosyltransferase FtsW [Bosea sp. (in: a-proteobacteria)]
MVSRAEPSLSGRWWWSIDRVILSALVALMVSGVVLLMAGGPPVAERLGLSTFHFVNRQAVYLVAAMTVFVGVSFLTPRQVRRLALLIFTVSLAMVVATLYLGVEVKGARRWLTLGPIGSIQPSEFLKPAFVVLAAWAFSEGSRRPDLPGTWIAFLLLPATIAPLVLQPDFGQTMLVTLVWAGLFFVAGLHWFWVLGLGGAGAVGILIAYQLVPHVRARIERFMDKGSGDTFQIDTALESFAQGGWLGKGPGEGTVKRILPDAHTDFIFAVTAEEFGIVVCILLVMLFALIVLRALFVAQKAEDPFIRLAVTGLALLFGIQAAINMMVNLHMMPAKGMTLPFISYGGSSLISLAIGTGFLLALTRKRPRAVDFGRFRS